METTILGVVLALINLGMYLSSRQIALSLTEIVKKNKDSELEVIKMQNETFSKAIKDIETAGKDSVKEISQTAKDIIQEIIRKPSEDLKMVAETFAQAMREENLKSYETSSLMLDAVMARSTPEFEGYRMQKEAMRTEAELAKERLIVREDMTIPKEPTKNPLDVTSGDFDDPFST